MADDKKEVRFHRPHKGYNAGEPAWFDTHVADAMCSGDNPPAYDPNAQAEAPAEPPVKAKAKSPKKKKAPKKK